MRNKLVLILILMGSTISGIAFFADALSLDAEPGWGDRRIIIFISGILLMLSALLYNRYKNELIAVTYSKNSLLSRIQRHPITRRLSELCFSYWSTLPFFVFVIVAYVWFASSGSWIDWDSPTRYYAELADGFKQGTLYLPIRPHSSLLDLPNPYDPSTRAGTGYLIDASLFNGRYYLYWGPVPSLVLVAISPFTHGKVGDLQLAFSFLCGIFLIQYILILSLWDRFFRDLPRWMLISSILVAGLCIPSTFLLINEPNGRIYEAAILGGQFFLMWGCLIVLTAPGNSSLSNTRLVVASILWALAIGTRLLLVSSVGFMLLMIVYRIYKAENQFSLTNYAVKLLSLGLPLILGIFFLGWYNSARFGSITETGHSYQLAAISVQKYQSELFSPVYIPQNIYNYFLHPPASLQQFPFLYPEEGSEDEPFSFYSLPQIYYSNPITGLLVISPFVLFAILPVIARPVKTSDLNSSKMSVNQNNLNLLNWIVASLVGLFLSAFFMLAVFFWAAMRYMEDFVPALSLISIIGFWQGYQLVAQKPVFRAFYAFIGSIFAAATIIMSTLLSVSVLYFGH